MLCLSLSRYLCPVLWIFLAGLCSVPQPWKPVSSTTCPFSLKYTLLLRMILLSLKIDRLWSLQPCVNFMWMIIPNTSTQANAQLQWNLWCPLSSLRCCSWSISFHRRVPRSRWILPLVRMQTATRFDCLCLLQFNYIWRLAHGVCSCKWSQGKCSTGLGPGDVLHHLRSRLKCKRRKWTIFINLRRILCGPWLFFGFLFTTTETAHLYFPSTLKVFLQTLLQSDRRHLLTCCHHASAICGGSSQTRPHDNTTLLHLNETPSASFGWPFLSGILWHLSIDWMRRSNSSISKTCDVIFIIKIALSSLHGCFIILEQLWSIFSMRLQWHMVQLTRSPQNFLLQTPRDFSKNRKSEDYRKAISTEIIIKT